MKEKELYYKNILFFFIGLQCERNIIKINKNNYKAPVYPTNDTLQKTSSFRQSKAITLYKCFHHKPQNHRSPS